MRKAATIKVTNWAEYEAGLRQRGGITFWISEAAIADWSAPRRKTRGGQRHYSDLPVPDHTTLSRRRANLVVFKTARYHKMNADTEPVHVLIDSAGLKIYGAGHWLEEKHGAISSRKWRKHHIAIDSDSGEVIARALSHQNSSDLSQLQICLDRLKTLLPALWVMALMTVMRRTDMFAAIALVLALSFYSVYESCKM